METCTIEVDDKTYKKLKKEQKNRPYNVKEMMFYDEIFDDSMTTPYSESFVERYISNKNYK